MKACLILLFLLISINSNSQTNNEFPVKGNIGSVKYLNYIGIEKFGEIIKDKKPEIGIFLFDELLIYNQDNLVTEEIQYLFDGKLNSKILHQFSERKLMKSLKQNSDGELDWIKIFTYNTENRLQKDTWYKSDEKTIISMTQYKYDSNSKLIMEQNYKSDGTVSRSIKYEYDNNNLSKMAGYSSKGEMNYEILYSYDKNNSLTETIDHNIIKGYYISTYNANKDIVDYAYKLNNGTLVYQRKMNYDYDLNENWIKKTIVEEDYKGKRDIKIVERIIKYKN